MGEGVEGVGPWREERVAERVKASLRLRETQSLASSGAPRVFFKRGYAKLGCTESFRMKRKIPECGQENPRMAPRPGGRAWLPRRAPKGKFSKFRSQGGIGKEGGPSRPGLAPGTRCDLESRPRGQRGRISARAALPPPGRVPRAASARPLGGACVLVGASPAQAKGTAEPGGGANPSPRVPGTGGQRRQPR